MYAPILLKLLVELVHEGNMQWPPLFAVADAGIAAGVALGLEAYLLIGALGGVLDRLEPMQIVE